MLQWQVPQAHTHKPVNELVKLRYDRSLFLRVCLSYLSGPKDNTSPSRNCKTRQRWAIENQDVEPIYGLKCAQSPNFVLRKWLKASSSVQDIIPALFASMFMTKASCIQPWQDVLSIWRSFQGPVQLNYQHQCCNVKPACFWDSSFTSVTIFSVCIRSDSVLGF